MLTFLENFLPFLQKKIYSEPHLSLITPCLLTSTSAAKN